MPGRSIWNGTIQFGGVSLPVKLYSAVEDATVHFHLLHGRDKERVRQRLEDPGTGEEVPREGVRRAFESEPGIFVLVDDGELEALSPKASREIEVTRFVDPRKIGYEWFERPYYLGPSGNGKQYFAFAEALARTKKEGIARWVMRKRHYVGALRVEGDHLMLVAMRHRNEIIDAARMPKLAGASPTKRERAMAQQLVEMLVGTFDPAEYRDEYRERVMALIETKARGKLFRFENPRRRPRPASLEKALEASISKAKKERRSA